MGLLDATASFEDLLDQDFIDDMRRRYADIMAQAERDKQTYGYPKAKVRICNKLMQPVAIAYDYRDLAFSDKLNAAGGLSMRLPANQTYTEAIIEPHIDAAIPIIVELPGYRTLWFVTSFTEHTDEHGAEWIDVIAISCWEYINRIALWPTPFMPAEFQPIKEWVGIGPAISLLKYWYLLPNLARLQAPFWQMPDGDLLSLQSWNLLRNAQWPIMIRPSSVIGDTSQWTAMSTRMDMAGVAFEDVLKTEGLQLQFELYIHGEDPQPFPELMLLDRTTLLVDIVEKADLKAFTGTFIDGLIRTGVSLLDDGLSFLTYPILGEEDYSDYFAKLVGTLPGKPWVVYHKGTVASAESVTHKPMASRATVGGHSPDWINKAAVAIANGLLGLLGTLIGLPGLGIGIFEDEVKDILFAFYTWEDRGRAQRAGPWRFREMFKEASSGLSLNALAAIKTTLWENRAWVSHKIRTTNGKPFFVGLHLNLGDPVGYEKRGKIITDHLYQIDYKDSRDALGQIYMEIGDGSQEREPGALALGKIRRFAGVLNRVALAG